MNAKDKQAWRKYWRRRIKRDIAEPPRLINKFAQALGRLAKGHKKNLTPKERARRRKQIEAINVKKAKRLNRIKTS